jgi:hypothetical protein
VEICYFVLIGPLCGVATIIPRSLLIDIYDLIIYTIFNLCNMSIGSTRNGGQWQYSVWQNGCRTVIPELSGMNYLKGTVLFPIRWRCKLMIPIGRLCSSNVFVWIFMTTLEQFKQIILLQISLIISALISSCHLQSPLL